MQIPEARLGPCACCGDALRATFDRRNVLRGIGAAGLALAAPRLALAAPKYKFEAMLLSCIDPRFQTSVFRAMSARGLRDQYSQFTVAGAAIGAVAPAFRKWHETFWENLDTTVQLHSITRIIAINHRDCGAAKIAYGEDKLADRDSETAIHRAAMAEFRKQVAEKQPRLSVEAYLMSLDGWMDALA